VDPGLRLDRLIKRQYQLSDDGLGYGSDSALMVTIVILKMTTSPDKRLVSWIGAVQVRVQKLHPDHNGGTVDTGPYISDSHCHRSTFAREAGSHCIAKLAQRCHALARR